MSEIPAQNITDVDELTDQSKVVSLFQFIRELNKLKQKAILNMREYPWFFALSDLPDDPENISVYYCDRIEEEAAESVAADSILLSVHKPEFHNCPDPDEILIDWLLPGWENFHNEARVREFLEHESETISLQKNLFNRKNT